MFLNATTATSFLARFPAKKQVGAQMHRTIYNTLLPRKECTGVRYVITKFSRKDGLPNFITHGAPLARFARWSSAKKTLYIRGHEPIYIRVGYVFERRF